MRCYVMHKYTSNVYKIFIYYTNNGHNENVLYIKIDNEFYVKYGMDFRLILSDSCSNHESTKESSVRTFCN